LSDAPATYELEVGWLCQRWNTLPKAGGVLDQPAGLLDRMETALLVYEHLLVYDKAGKKVFDRSWVAANKQTVKVANLVVRVRRDLQNDG